MHELRTTIPDPDVVLTLEPEELAATLLMLMRPEPCQRHSASTTWSAKSILRIGAAGSISGYPRDRWPDLELAVA